MYDSGSARPFRKPGQYTVGHHALHFARNPRQGKNRAVSTGNPKARCRTDGVGHDGRGGRNQGLLLIVRRHPRTPVRESGLQRLHGCLVKNQFVTDRQGNGIAGDVVCGGTQATGHDNHIAPADTPLQHFGHPSDVVADRAFVIQVDANRVQLLGNPGRVGVNRLTQQNLGSGGDDFTLEPGRRGHNERFLDRAIGVGGNPNSTARLGNSPAEPPGANQRLSTSSLRNERILRAWTSMSFSPSSLAIVSSFSSNESLIKSP